MEARHVYVDSRKRHLCDRCDKWKGSPLHVEPETRRYDKRPRSDDYKAGYDAGYHAGFDAGVRAAR